MDLGIQVQKLNWLYMYFSISGLISKKTTAEGLEFMYATNYFGPFLLTHLLLGNSLNLLLIGKYIHQKTLYLGFLDIMYVVNLKSI